MPHGLTFLAMLALSGIYVAVLIVGHALEAWLAKRRPSLDSCDVSVEGGLQPARTSVPPGGNYLFQCFQPNASRPRKISAGNRLSPR